MFKKQCQPTKYEQKTEPMLVRSGTPDISTVECLDGPKFEVEGGAKVEATVEYGGSTFTGSVTASGKGKFGARICGRKKTTPQWWVDVTYQREIKVMCQTLGLAYPIFGTDWTDPSSFLVFEHEFDSLEPDYIGPWVELSRSQEYRKDKIEFEQTSVSLYDPPNVAAVPPSQFHFAEGLLQGAVADFDGKDIEVSVGGVTRSAKVQRHRLLVDQQAIDPTKGLDIGVGLLGVGKHVATIDAMTNLGPIAFDIPFGVVPQLEIHITDPTRTMMFDERRVVRAVIENHTRRDADVRVSAVSSGHSWTVISPVNPVAIPAQSKADIDLEIHAFPENDVSLTTDIKILATGNGARAEASFTVTAVMPISVVRELEREVLRFAQSARGSQKNYFFR